MNLVVLKQRLVQEEGSWSRLYDDATGKELKKGDLIVGNATVGVGRCLFTNPLSQSEIDFLLDNDVVKIVEQCQTLPWWGVLNEARQVVIADFCFNVGLVTLLTFKKMIACIQAGDWPGAAAEVRNSRYHQQVGYRAEGIARTLETGVL